MLSLTKLHFCSAPSLTLLIVLVPAALFLIIISSNFSLPEKSSFGFYSKLPQHVRKFSLVDEFFLSFLVFFNLNLFFFL